MKAGGVFQMIEGVEYKECTKCMEFKTLEEFPLRPGRPSFYRDCSPCRIAQMTEYRKENKWKMDIMHKNYSIIHRVKLRNKNRERARIERETDPLPRLESSKKYRATAKCKATKKRSRNKGYQVGDVVLFQGERFSILGVRNGVGYLVSRKGLPPVTISKKNLVPVPKFTF